MYSYNYLLIEELDESPAFLLSFIHYTHIVRFEAQNRACKLRIISSNIIHHLEGRSELRDAFPCELGFKVKVYKET